MNIYGLGKFKFQLCFNFDQLRFVVRGHREGIAAHRHQQVTRPRGLSTVSVGRWVSTWEISSIWRTLQQHRAPDMGRNYGTVPTADRSAVRGWYQCSSNLGDRTWSTIVASGFADYSSGWWVPRSCGNGDGDCLGSVYGPWLYVDWNAIGWVRTFTHFN